MNKLECCCYTSRITTLLLHCNAVSYIRLIHYLNYCKCCYLLLHQISLQSHNYSDLHILELQLYC